MLRFWRQLLQDKLWNLCEEDLLKWLATTRRRLQIDSARRSAVRRVSMIEPAVFEGIPDCSELDPCADVEVSELPAHLAAALSLLPVEQREVVVLRYGEGLTNAQIVERLGVPPTTVNSRLHRARKNKKPRAHLERNGFG